MAASSSRTHSECRFPGPSHWLSWNHTQGMHSAQVCAACLYLCHTCTSIFALLYTNEGEGWLSLSPNPFILFYMSLLLGFFVFGLYYFLITYICVCVLGGGDTRHVPQPAPVDVRRQHQRPVLPSTMWGLEMELGQQVRQP